MKFLFIIVAFSACMLATTLSVPVAPPNAYGPRSVNAVPVGHLESQRILASGKPAIIDGSYGPQVYGPAAVHVGPASAYGSGYGHDAQVQSLIKLALALPTPKPDASIHGPGYGSPYPSHGSPSSY